MPRAALTERQKEIADLLGEGKTVAQVAKRVKISPNSVYQHIKRMREAGHTVGVSKSKAKRRGRPKLSEPKTSPQLSGVVTTGAVRTGANEISLNGKQPTLEEHLASELETVTGRISEIETQETELDVEKQSLIHRHGKLDAANQALVGAGQ